MKKILHLPNQTKAIKEREIYSKNLSYHLLGLLVIVAILLTACGGETDTTESPPPTEIIILDTPTPPVDPLADLITAAQAEGILATIALPHEWCNYGEVIETFKARYGLEVNELNPEANSSDQVEAIKAGKDNPGSQTPDVIDIGLPFAALAREEALIQPYKVSNWDSIPVDAKEADGYWYGDYFGVISFLVNTDVQPDVPHDWADLLDAKYKGQVALSGDPRSTNRALQSAFGFDQAIQSVFASSLANGGSLNDARPGLDYFAKMNAAGNLMPFISNTGLVANGDTPIRLTWDYIALAAVDSFSGSPKAEVVIPASGRFAGMYVQAISAYAPHPNAARLWMEYIYSDEGQILWMKGKCHPIREADLRARGVIPADVLSKLPDVSGAVFPSLDQLNAAEALITANWNSVVGANIQSAP